jgi:hypothetical protein
MTRSEPFPSLHGHRHHGHDAILGKQGGAFLHVCWYFVTIVSLPLRWSKMPHQDLGWVAVYSFDYTFS